MTWLRRSGADDHSSHPGRSRTISVLLAALLLVGVANVAAYAATGKPLLLGKSNTASDITKLRNKDGGAALSLRTKSTSPPLKVSSRVKVDKLNASLLDGRTADELGTSTYVYAIPEPQGQATVHRITFSTLPPGTYLATYNMVGNLTSGSMRCLWRANTSTPAAGRFGLAVGPSDGTLAAANATTTFEQREENSKLYYLECAGPTPFALSYVESFGWNPASSQVIFTRVDALTWGTGER